MNCLRVIGCKNQEGLSTPIQAAQQFLIQRIVSRMGGKTWIFSIGDGNLTIATSHGLMQGAFCRLCRERKWHLSATRLPGIIWNPYDASCHRLLLYNYYYYYYFPLKFLILMHIARTKLLS